MGESCMDIGVGENGETPRYMNIPVRHMMRGERILPNPNPRSEERKRRFLIKAFQRPPRGIDAKLAAKGYNINRESIISQAQQLGLSLESIAPFLNAFSTTTTTTDTKAEVIHKYPLKSLPSSESPVDDTNPAPESTAATASTSGTKAEVQGGSLLKRPCEVLGESGETLQENKKQMVSALSAAGNSKIHSYCCFSPDDYYAYHVC